MPWGMRIIVLGLPHTQTSRRFSHCAYTQKVYNLCKMMVDRGHEVIHVGVEVADGPPCTKNIACVSEADWAALYGKKRPEDYFDISVDDDAHRAYAARFAEGMRRAVVENMGPDRSSIVCLTWNGAQRTAVEGLPQWLVESGIGYRNTWANFRVYESYAWMHFLMGRDGLFEAERWYWAVIPNAFDTSLFEYRPKKSDYFLYLGRLNVDKGVQIAINMAKEAGVKIKLAGQGDPKKFQLGSHVEYVGPVGVDERRELLAGARALCCPTKYLGPFEGVHIEAGFSGTPVITTDWGVFSETVLNGLTGFRCRTWEQFVWAAKHVDKIAPETCRQWTEANFSLERVGAMYEEYFQQVLAVAEAGWPSVNESRRNLDWLKRSYPLGASQMLDLEPNPMPTPKPAPTEWERAQEWEREWWKDRSRWEAEIKKQTTYARLMGMPTDLDFGDKQILDVGCGPVSMLFRSTHGSSVGIDPMPLGEDAGRHDVAIFEMKAEDFKPFDRFDEAWCYNCLQHTEDPKRILEMMATCADAVRIFEWVELPPCQGHPQTITEEMLLAAFPGWERRIHNVGSLPGFGGTVTNKYVALHLVRRVP